MTAKLSKRSPDDAKEVEIINNEIIDNTWVDVERYIINWYMTSYICHEQDHFWGISSLTFIKNSRVFLFLG